jgi:hypothetical protein
MLAAKHERWAQLDDVAVDSLAAGEHAFVAQPIDQLAGLLRSRRAAVAVDDQLDTERKTGPAHDADDVVFGRKRLQTCLEVSPDGRCVGEQILVLQDVEYGKACGARDVIAAEGGTGLGEC